MSERMIEGMRGDDAPAKNKGGRPRKNPVNPVRPEIASEAGVVEKVRPALNSRSEAEEYARQLLEDDVRSDDVVDEFYISPDSVPDGWTYNWKRESTMGMNDNHHINQTLQNGWRPVQASRHPGIMPAGYEGPVRKKGLMLMELPAVLTERAMKKHIQESKAEILNSEKRLHETPGNTAPREEFPDRLKGVKRDWGAAPEQNGSQVG